MEVRSKGMSVDQFMRRFDEDGPFELIDGEEIAMTPPSSDHGLIANTLAYKINRVAIERGLGQAFVELTFVLKAPHDPTWVSGSRVPDVMYYQAERLAAYRAAHPDSGSRPFALIPDLVVEIISPTDRHTQIETKINSYLADGVWVVWVIVPDKRTVTVYAGQSRQVLGPDDTLTGSDIIPDFTLAVDALFAAML